MKDVIYLLHSGEITSEEAQEIFDSTLHSGPTYVDSSGQTRVDWPSLLGFSKREATAYLHGASLEDIVDLRYGGWPTECRVCQDPINYDQEGFWFKRDAEETPYIRYPVCPGERP
jgi:hypothetical protein